MKRFTAYVINHTHWDREWFLTSVYTSRWIAGLIDQLAELVEWNPAFHFFLDGQTLVLEDLYQDSPHYWEKVDQLVRRGNLLIGPYYCQPDWRMTCGEALLRNFLFGWHDMQMHGSQTQAGWLVDTFGHISQAPQLHNLFGLHTVYIWRGAPIMEPYFNWHSPDGTQTFTINLFGGYRNLYGVTRIPELAVIRLQAEIDKLAPYYPTAEIPLFDGYDLEDNPEDPVRFYQAPGVDVPAEIDVREATPESYAEMIWQKGLALQKDLDFPSIQGELISGKYGAVFPGTLSSRIYLKRMAHDCEHLLYQVCEPLAVLARQKGRRYPAESYEAWGRALLQNAVHDCICGVSIDQVHEKMEYSYRQVFEGLQADLQNSLHYVLDDFAPGTYAVSTNPFPYDGWLASGGRLYHVQTDGVGVWQAGEQHSIREPAKPVEEFRWKNAHYEAWVRPDGTVQVGEAVLGRLQVYEERGDTYSGETGRFIGALTPSGQLVIEQESERHCVLSINYSTTWDQIEVSAVLRLTFDPSPLIQWQVELDGRGTDYRVEIVFETSRPGQVHAGMPFDITQRETVDRDLLPRQLDDRLAALLLGQRELIETRTFPFQDFVAISDGAKSAIVFAQGLHAYQADEQGSIAIILNRAVEWLTKPDLEHRVGDAGPFFYVPDGRGERVVIHHLAVMLSDSGLLESQVLVQNAAFQNPPLLVEVETGSDHTQWRFFQESLPLSSLHMTEGHILARLFNPTTASYALSRPYMQADVFGHPVVQTKVVPAKQILTLSLGSPDAAERDASDGRVRLLNPPAWHVGQNQGLPDPEIIQQLKDKIARLERQIEEAAGKLPLAAKRERYFLQHRLYVLQREMLEYRLSARLNEIKLAMQGQLSHAYMYEPDEQIAVIGGELNELRIKRRIYDYVIQAVGAMQD